jgi:mycobactin peptide synthetase MbtF
MTATGTETGSRPDIAPDIEDVMALSPLQEGLYSLTVLSALADSVAEDPYVIGMAADISGALDADLLRDCAAKMLTRHPNLRASFFSQGIPRPVQIVPSRVELPWRHVAAAPEDVATLEAAERRRPFDFERAPAIRFLLIELPGARWRLVITAHHIVIDGWSLPVFVNEMMILYWASGHTAITSGGWGTAIKLQVSRSGANIWQTCRARRCCRPPWAVHRQTPPVFREALNCA